MKSFNKKIKLSFVLSIVAIFVLMQLFTFASLQSLNVKEVYAWDGVSFETPTQGLGTQAEPYLINSAEQLKWVSMETNTGNFPPYTYFELNDNIDLEDYEWTPIGTETNPFRGNFNGNGYTIYNINLKDETNIYTYSGLFGYTSGATIQNLRVNQVDFLLDLTQEVNPVYVGAIVGYASSNTTLRAIMNGGTIQITNATSTVYAGGLVGYLKNSTLTQAQNSIVLSTLEVDDIYLGGLVGKTDNSTITSSYNKQTINVSSNNTLYVGGVSGEVYQSQIQKVYNEGFVTGKGVSVWVGGVAGLVSSGTGVLTYEQKLMYNVKKVTLFATDALSTNLYAGGVFGQVQERNNVSYMYNSEEVALDLLSAGTTTNMGTLSGSLELGATLQFSYYNISEQVGGDDGVGEALGAVTDVYYLTLSAMRSKDNYHKGADWNFNTIWLTPTGNLNGGLPTLRYVGNYSIHAQVYGGGSLSPSGVSFYASGIGPVYTITAFRGYQIKQIVYNDIEDNSYRGKTTASYNIANNGMPTTTSINFAVIFEEIPFVKTQMFYYLIGVGSLILFMIIGTAVINRRYAVKMDKIMEEKKKTLNFMPEDILEKEKTPKPKPKTTKTKKE